MADGQGIDWLQQMTNIGLGLELGREWVGSVIATLVTNLYCSCQSLSQISMLQEI